MLWIAVFCSFLLIEPAASNGIEKLEPIQRQHNVSAISCVVQLCEQYYYTKKNLLGSLVMVHIQNATPMHNQLIASLMESNVYSIDLINQYSRCTHNCYSNFSTKAKHYFVAFRELNEVVAALRLWRELPTWNPLAQFVAYFLNFYDEKTLFAHIKFVLNMFFELHVLNVKVISSRKDSNVVQAHTWYPYEGTNCADEVRNIHLINECFYSDDRIGQPQPMSNITEAQPVIPLDLHGCPLRIATSVYEPFVYYDAIRKDFTRGIDVFLALTIAKALKMKPVFIRINETRENREVSNETGIYSMLLRRTADVLIGGLDDDQRVKRLLSASRPYLQDDMTWCVGNAEPRELWSNIFRIYTPWTWTSIFAMTIVVAIVIKKFIHSENVFKNFVWTFMMTIAAILGKSVTYQPSRLSIRIMMVFLFMYGLIISTSFCTFLISTLTQPRLTQQINSIPEAIENGFKFASGNVASEEHHYHHDDPVSVAVRENYIDCDDIDECLVRLRHDNHLAVALSRYHADNSLKLSRMERWCFSYENNVYSYSVVMPFKKDFELMEPINSIIENLAEFGLFDQWIKMSEGPSFSSLIANAKKIDPEEYIPYQEFSHYTADRTIVLTMEHIIGALVIMAFGYLLAIIAFLVEIIVHRRVQQRSAPKFVLSLHRFFGPKRAERKTTVFSLNNL